MPVFRDDGTYCVRIDLWRGKGRADRWAVRAFFRAHREVSCRRAVYATPDEARQAAEGAWRLYVAGKVGRPDAPPVTMKDAAERFYARTATESGRKMYATLLAVSGSFAGITDAAAMGGAYGTRDLKTSSFASRTDYLRAQRATGRAEAVIVSDPKVMNELAQLRAQFGNLEASQVSMARFALKSAQDLEKWEGIGMPVERAAL